MNNDRLLNKTILIFLAIFVLITPAIPIYASATDCADVSFVFLRGSGQNGGTKILGDRNKYINSELYSTEEQTKTFFEELDKRINNQTKEFVSFHNQGGHQYGYKALGVSSMFDKASHNTKTTIRSNAYYESMYDGSDALAQYVKKKVVACPTQKIVLGGYSQGAQVVGETLPRLSQNERQNIKYVAMFGDPKLNTKDNSSVFKKGPWVKGTVNRFVNGILGARVQYIPDDIRDKTGSWCDIGDPVCAGRSIATNIVTKGLYDKFVDKTHSNIYQDKWISQSVGDIMGKIDPVNSANKNAFAPNEIFYKQGKRPVTDIVLIVDNALSMTHVLEKIRANSQQIAESLLKDKPDTQVSVIRYGNQSMPFYGSTMVYAEVYGQPTNDVNNLANTIGNIHPWGSTNPYTTLFDALDVAVKLEQKTGRPGAQKQFLLVTNNGYGPLDHLVLDTSMTSTKIYNRMLELDPAIANAIVLPDLNGEYTALTDIQKVSGSTNGQISQTTDQDIVPTIGNFSSVIDTSPVASISNVEYENDSILATAGDSYDPNSYINKYKWDCNADGQWDYEDSQPSVKCDYDQSYKGNIVLEVESFDGQSAKAIYGVDVTYDSNKVISNLQSLESPVVDTSSEPRKAWHIVNAYDKGTIFNVYDSNGDLVAFSDTPSIDITYLPDSNSNYNVYATNDYLVSEPTNIRIIASPETIKSKIIDNTPGSVILQTTLPTASRQYATSFAISNIYDASQSITDIADSIIGNETKNNSQQSDQNKINNDVSGVSSDNDSQNSASIANVNPFNKLLGKINIFYGACFLLLLGLVFGIYKKFSNI